MNTFFTDRSSESLLEGVATLSTISPQSPYYSDAQSFITEANKVLSDRARNILAFTGVKPDWATSWHLYSPAAQILIKKNAEYQSSTS